MSDYRITPQEAMRNYKESQAKKAVDELNKAEAEKKAKAIKEAEYAKEIIILNEAWKVKIANKDLELNTRKSLDNYASENISETIVDKENSLPCEQSRKNYEGNIALALEEAEPWHNQEGQSGITVIINGHYEHYLLESTAFKDWFYRKHYKHNKFALSKSAYNEALDTINAICKYEGKKYNTYSRIGESDGKIYIDLANDNWEIIELDESGWRIVNHAHIKFARTKDMLPQCRPEKDGNIEELLKFINVETRDQFALLVGFILKCLDPHSPYPVLTVLGEQGSGKTEICQMIISLIAPSSVPLRSMPSSEHNLLLAAKHNHIFAIDNLSSISHKQSDWICRLSTGAGFSRRTIFTDSDETAIAICRPIILNGINDIIDRPDLLDRAVVLNLPQIKNRRDKYTFWQEFNAAKPKILGVLYDALVCALRYREIVELTYSPRLIDFAKFVTAAESAFGWSYETFLRAYARSIEECSDENIYLNPLALAIVAYMEKRTQAGGPATGLINAIKYECELEQYSKFIPMHPNKFSQELMRIAPLLRKKGIEVSRAKKNGERLIILTRTTLDTT